MKSAHRRAAIYTLSIAAICSSWTFFVSVGKAVSGDWSQFLPAFIGPALALTLFYPIWHRIATVAKRENVGSLADFLSSRYGKSRALGALVTAVSMIGALPYLALQLVSLAEAWAVVTGTPEPPPLAAPIILFGLAALAIVLGTRRPSLTRHNRGLVRVVAIESGVKIAAIVAAAVLALILLSRQPPGTLTHALALAGPAVRLDIGFATAVLLCTVSAFALPMQFHLAFVELEDPQDLKVARWLLPAYLAVWCIALVGIGLIGKTVLSDWSNPDMMILGLFVRHGGSLLVAFIFLGGFSAAAAVVMVETVALSAMISNELVLPWVAKTRLWARLAGPDAGRGIVFIRRASIVAVLILASFYSTLINRDSGLQGLGFTTFAAAAQLVPALIGAVFWRRGHAQGAIWGIVAGTLVWLFLGVAPQLAAVQQLLRPVLPLEHFPYQYGVIASLALNSALYVLISLRTSASLVDRIQATMFSQAGGNLAPSRSGGDLDATVGELRQLLRQFLGREDAENGFEDFERGQAGRLKDQDPVSPSIARAAERMLAGAIGASSARNVIALALAGGGKEVSDVRDMLDEAAQAVQFSRDLLQTSLDSLEQGVCVVDRDIRIIAWNRRYLELFSHDPRDIYVGKLLEELIRGAAPRRQMNDAELQRVIEERIGPIQRREPQTFERDWPNGLTLKVTGVPLVSGEYVTSFIDVTELRSSARALAQANELLEQRVSERTHELTLAKAQAERATRSQARFVAAASHDLLQPIHAARLFLGAATEDLASYAEARELVSKADVSIDAADRMLRALLNLSRLEVGNVTAEVKQVDVNAVLAPLRREFEHPARDRGIELKVVQSRLWVLSDPDLLRSILQNLIGNAVRYTAAGGKVVVGCRRRGDAVRIEVRDNGPGISEADLPKIFEEFFRLPGAAQVSGAGLGLAIADRLAKALGHRLEVWSRVGTGSAFTLTAPQCAPARADPAPPRTAQGLPRQLNVLCLDDEPPVLDALTILLRRWGAEVDAAGSIEEANRLEGGWDVILADYQLGSADTGLDFLEGRLNSGAVLALITANTSDDVAARASAMGIDVIRKPLSPVSLRAFLTRAAQTDPRD